jgi:hypothetical protein
MLFIKNWQIIEPARFKLGIVMEGGSIEVNAGCFYSQVNLVY